ncbi:MAG: DUF488 domain-containing protein [Proteobacteria bacterium]|nr:DUF488 domain-containing protein [Pseudomonadota bacterium]
MEVRIKRAYEAPSVRDGARVLVDRIWPRGLRKADAAVEVWLKEIAPSTRLRQWFAHDPARWAEFRRRYRAELAGKAGLLTQLRASARNGKLTLVYSARDTEHNQAVVLREVLSCKKD